MVPRTRFAGLLLILVASAAIAQTTPSSLFIVHFEVGPKWDASLDTAEQPSFREHSANLNRLREEGVIVFGARYNEFGVVFLRVDSLAAAAAIVDADPGVRSGMFAYKLAPLSVFYPWRE
jgi:uncharacterized protein YciI